MLREDVELMRRVGATSASIAVFSWTALEPRPGHYTFEWLDATMDRFHAAGLSVFLATPSGSKPLWLAEQHPEIRRVCREGRRAPIGGRHNHCLTAPAYRQAVTRINHELARRYGAHPALALWHVGNEFSGECHCDLCRDAFQEWLQRRYGSLERLNQAWWTAFWNHTFTEWTQIPTHDPSIDGLAVDWLRFVNHQHTSFLETELAPLRALSPRIPCTTNFMGTCRTNDYRRWRPLLDCVSNDIYPLHDDRDDSWRKSLGADFTHSLMRGLAGGDPWILMECAPGAVNWSKVNKLKRPGVHLQEVLQAVANGADVIHYFQWRKSRGGYEKHHSAVIDHEGGDTTRLFQECAWVGRVLEALAPVAGRRPERAPVALVYDWEARWALEASAGPKAGASLDRYTEACVEHFRALRCAGVEVDVVGLDVDLAAYRLVVTPALYALPQTLAERLSRYANSGGAWVATYLTGYVDEHNLCWRGGFPGPNLRGLFGLWNEEVDYLFDDEKVEVRGALFGARPRAEARDIVEVLHAEGATVLATLASEFYAGSPVILHNRPGLGDTFYVGARLAEADYVSFYEHVAAQLHLARQKLPHGVVRKMRPGSHGPVEFLFNYNRKEVTVDLGAESFHRLSDGHLCRGRTVLGPYDSLLRGVPLPQQTPTTPGEVAAAAPAFAALTTPP